MDKIRILHVVSSLGIDGGVMGVLMNYYRHIDRTKVQFDFLYFIESEKNHIEEIKKLGGEIYYLPRPSIKSYIKYKDFFKENANTYKAVHLHEVYLNSVILPIAKRYGIKHLITHSHATKFSDKKISAIRNKILCLPIKKQANIYLACSKAAGKTVYGEKYVEFGKVKVINNAVNIDRYKYNQDVREKVRNNLKINGKFVVGHVGRFNEQKNHKFIIEIFAEIKKKKPNSLLMLIGDGPLFEHTKEKVKLFALEDSVMFLGRKGNVQDYFQAMDSFILPSLFEGLPVVGVEAQASGLPIILSSDITQEIGLINYTYIGLNQSTEYWAEKVLSIGSNENRMNSYIDVVRAGFNIIQESKKLEELYRDLI
ncbi:glycosyltransferase family 1 protein [Bacillus sp. V59.32b]|uniref:glycosyltransferase family 1 protein n=1 Tax=Bacillus sp. V59.32b TaxID=1758642 RepID=UPI000E3C4F69|nr:glycosyltransferase family 1 protein [Bacillus sp. V59.32b]RFU62721.1 glycosyltransferase family 1 protein [Bacillus sp. V59.32b]